MKVPMKKQITRILVESTEDSVTVLLRKAKEKPIFNIVEMISRCFLLILSIKFAPIEYPIYSEIPSNRIVMPKLKPVLSKHMKAP